jgi:hypothetical protein
MPALRNQSLIPPGFVQALITYADVNGDAGVITTEFNALYARIKAGEGAAIVSTSVNGKSFGYEVTVTVEELFSAYGEALRQLKDDASGATVATYADFSQLQR